MFAGLTATQNRLEPEHPVRDERRTGEDGGLQFYRDQLGHELVWRNDAVGQVGLRLPESQAELVLSTNLEYAVNWLVTSVSEAVETVVEAGGKVILEPTQIPVSPSSMIPLATRSSCSTCLRDVM